jgi:hypothetical protein
MNFPFKKILCPIGFDDQEGIALEAARQLAGGVTTIYLLHVVPALPAIGEPHVAKTAKTRSLRRLGPSRCSKSWPRNGWRG